MSGEILGSNIPSPSVDAQSYYAPRRHVQAAAQLTSNATVPSLLDRADMFGNGNQRVTPNELAALETSSLGAALLPPERAALPAAWEAMRTVVATSLAPPTPLTSAEPRVVTTCAPGLLNRTAPVRITSLPSALQTLAMRVATLAGRTPATQLSLADVALVSTQHAQTLTPVERTQLRAMSLAILARYPSAELQHFIDFSGMGTTERTVLSHQGITLTERRTRQVFYGTRPFETSAEIVCQERTVYRLDVPTGAVVAVFDDTGTMLGRFTRPAVLDAATVSGRPLRIELWRNGAPTAACETTLPSAPNREWSFAASPGVGVMLDGVAAQPYQVLPSAGHPLFYWRANPVLLFATATTPGQSTAAQRRAPALAPEAPPITAGVYTASDGAVLEVSPTGSIVLDEPNGTRYQLPCSSVWLRNDGSGVFDINAPLRMHTFDLLDRTR